MLGELIFLVVERWKVSLQQRTLASTYLSDRLAMLAMLAMWAMLTMLTMLASPFPGFAR